MAIKLLIGGSPCTKWSIAQTKDREIQPNSGIGWDLFENYLIAKAKFKPDFFLYENNKSAAQPIKDEIARRFGVGVDPDVRFTDINSALVSAQNRQRFYVTNFGDIEQPEDRGILLKDILETGQPRCEKSPCIDAMIPPCGQRNQDKARTITAGHQTCSARDLRMDIETDGFMGKQGVIEKVQQPIRVGCMPSPDGTIKNSQAMRVYDVDGKSVNLTAQGGGLGAKTGLYAIRVDEPMRVKEATKRGYVGINVGDCVDLTQPNSKTRRGRSLKEKSNCLTTTNQQYEYCGVLGYATPCEWDENGVPTKAISCADGKTYTVYEVKDGQITIKDKQYPIKLVDGYYIIRKLTVRECARLQTMPDDYCKAVSDSRAYAALGNGWTAEVIIWLLNHALKDVPRDEEIIVLSMYDGIATGRYCLDKMGFTNVTYHAYEIDKYPIMVAMDNYPDIIQHGDAFAVREDDWSL